MARGFEVRRFGGERNELAQATYLDSWPAPVRSFHLRTSEPARPRTTAKPQSDLRSEETRRKQEHCAQELEDALDGNPDEPERQEQQPDDGIEDQCEQGDRPAEDEQHHKHEVLAHLSEDYDRSARLFGSRRYLRRS